MGYEPTSNGGYRSTYGDFIYNGQSYVEYVSYCHLSSYYWENGSWHYSAGIFWAGQYKMETCPSFDGYPTELPPDGCQKCVEEWAQLEPQCGGADKVINWVESTCTGECQDPCKQEGAATNPDCNEPQNQGPPCEDEKCCQD